MIGGSAEYVFSGAERYVRARLTGPHGLAWTQPVFLSGFDRDPYADAVIAASGVPPAQAALMIGPATPGWADHATLLNAGQSASMDMGAGEEIVDGPGWDVYVETVEAEAVAPPDQYVVLASVAPADWRPLGGGSGDACFDLGKASLGRARYLRIEARSPVQIDAVVALDPTLRDPYADAVVRFDDTKLVGGTVTRVLGPPYPGALPRDWSDYAVGIAAGGYVVLDMGPGEELSAREGADLRVAVREPNDEALGGGAYVISVSMDGSAWLPAGVAAGPHELELPPELPRARYVRLDVTSGSCVFDAVEAPVI